MNGPRRSKGGHTARVGRHLPRDGRGQDGVPAQATLSGYARGGGGGGGPGRSALAEGRQRVLVDPSRQRPLTPSIAPQVQSPENRTDRQTTERREPPSTASPAAAAAGSGSGGGGGPGRSPRRGKQRVLVDPS